MTLMGWSSAKRLAHCAVVLLRHGAAVALGGRLRRWPLVRTLPPANLGGPERLRAVIEDMGGTFVKFGQMLALQPDLLSLRYCNALYDLLDRVPPTPYEDVAEVFRQETGHRPEEVFEVVERRPLATASIGQVHLAVLHGQRVAVKIQRPSVPREFGGDVRLMTGMLAVIRTLRLKWLYWLLEPTSEFVAWTREELDYRCEARYLEQIRHNARDSAHERVPRVWWELTSSRTLVTEFLDGVTLLDHLRALQTGGPGAARTLDGRGFDAHQFARHVIDNFLNDAYRHGLFHADLHPANLMILRDNVVGYIDFGITGVLSAYSRRNLAALTLAYTRGDLPAMAVAFLRGAALGARGDPEAFTEGLRRLASDWYEPLGRRRRLRKNFTLVMIDMLKLSRQTDVWPERDIIKYIRSAIALDGLITRFAPSFDLGRHLEAVCDRHLRAEARRALLSYDALVEWIGGGTTLAHDGAARLAALVERMTLLQPPAGSAHVPGAGGALRVHDGAALQAAAWGVLAATAILGPGGDASRWWVAGGLALAAAATAVRARPMRKDFRHA
jgi:predicted unusual protein kinase regulating ubiquinone biosynthesis (AarF/ABC1/UbiB family)